MRTTNNNAIITHGAMAQDDANSDMCHGEARRALLVP